MCSFAEQGSSPVYLEVVPVKSTHERVRLAPKQNSEW
jgi:hypothetical protein